MTNPTLDQIIAAERTASDAQIVAKVCGRDVTRLELKIAFALVENRDNWKMPIDAIVELNPVGRAMVAEAVTFFTGSVAKFTAVGNGNEWRVTAAGYYNAVGA